MIKICLLLIIILLSACCDETGDNQYFSDIKVLPGHAIPDSNTAAKIAEAIWLSNFGKSMVMQKPYIVKLQKDKDTIWHIEGRFPKNENPKVILKGGSPYLSIRSRDCKILELYFTE